jgi:hypothetical protein
MIQRDSDRSSLEIITAAMAADFDAMFETRKIIQEIEQAQASLRAAEISHQVAWTRAIEQWEKY